MFTNHEKERKMDGGFYVTVLVWFTLLAVVCSTSESGEERCHVKQKKHLSKICLQWCKHQFPHSAIALSVGCLSKVLTFAHWITMFNFWAMKGWEVLLPPDATIWNKSLEFSFLPLLLSLTSWSRLCDQKSYFFPSERSSGIFKIMTRV